jgi:Na+-driven multidrug efflux pump
MEIIPSEENNKYFKAKKRVEELKSFYMHIIAYIILIPIWIFINYKTYWGFKWFWVPIFGMGTSVIIHAFKVFRHNNGWEERKIKEFMAKDQL